MTQGTFLRSPWSVAVTIPDTEDTGSPVSLEGASFGGIFAEASFDGSSLTWEVTHYTDKDPDPDNWDWFGATDGLGSPLTTQLSARDYAPLPPELFGARYVRPVSSGANTGDGVIIFYLVG